MSSNINILETDLRLALEQEQFELCYQPQVDLETGRVAGTEALLRWKNPNYGMVSPAEFIPLAEETDLIVNIGLWVIEEACRQCKCWQDEGCPIVTMSVNVSVVQFHQQDFVQQVGIILEDTGLAPALLELEITESGAPTGIDCIAEALNSFRALGIRIAIDDFGTGYSNLSWLSQFHIDKIKIDQSFVRSIDNKNWVIVRSVVQLAQNLGLITVAEGIETREQMQRLTGLGCHLGQGVYYSQPLSAVEFGEYLKAKTVLLPATR
jgi:EAL domain-containing protein (putative c-di-GMP-specific phosphodiesterase class I)